MTALPYLAPLACFALLNSVIALLPRPWYPLLYALNMVATTAVLWHYHTVWRDLRFNAKIVAPAILVGLAVFAEWILVEKFISYPHLGSRTGSNPYAEIRDPALRACFLPIRFWGLVAVVPLAEELCWRSFVLRYWTDADRGAQPGGPFSLAAYLVSAVGFSATHSEWLAALLCAAAYTWLLRRTGTLAAPVVAHAVTNLALGAYVLATGAWYFW